MDKDLTIRIGQRWVRIAVVALALVAMTLPAAVFASHQFTDVPNSSPYHGAISWMKDYKITSGCSATKYCPTANVTRQEMAVFMNKLANVTTPTFVESEEGLGGVLNNVPPNSDVCKTSAAYTPTTPKVAIIDARTSAIADSTTGNYFLRITYSTNGGTTWTATSNKVSPQEFVNTTDHGTASYVDDLNLTAGTSYLFAVRVSGPTLDQVRCQLLVTINNRQP